MTRYKFSQFDLMILTVKAEATKALMQEMGDWLAESNLPVLSLQNGVDNEFSIEVQIGRDRTVGGLAVRIGGHIIEPGFIQATGPAEIVMGAWPNAEKNPERQERLSEFVRLFNQADIPTTLTPAIQNELWRKLLINNGVNPLPALTRLDTRALTSHPVYGKTVYRLMEEAAAAAKADNVTLSNQDVDEMYQLICQFDAIKTSMLVDREKGRPLELDDISGAIIRRCKTEGVDAPNTELVQALLSQQVDR